MKRTLVQRVLEEAIARPEGFQRARVQGESPVRPALRAAAARLGQGPMFGPPRLAAANSWMKPATLLAAHNLTR